MEKFYKNSEFDIRIYKTKDMEHSKQIIKGDNKLCILTGIASFLHSCLDTKLMTPDELEKTVNMIFEARKNGIKNTVIYNNFKK